MSERIDKIKEAVQARCGGEPKHLESVPVREIFNGDVVWEGVVEVFHVTGQPMISRCYAWSFHDGTETRFVTVLKTPPIMSAVDAVRAFIMASRESNGVKVSD